MIKFRETIKTDAMHEPPTGLLVRCFIYRDFQKFSKFLAHSSI